MRDSNPGNDKDIFGHDHEVDPISEAEVLDITSRLPVQENDIISEIPIVPPDEEVETLQGTLWENRLTSILSVAIGSVIVGAVYPAMSNIENKTVKEATVTGVASLFGWAVFYVSIPYIQESKIGKLFTKKDNNTEKS